LLINWSKATSNAFGANSLDFSIIASVTLGNSNNTS
jgi:hypothetical protein